jgi:hypothetical protein
MQECVASLPSKKRRHKHDAGPQVHCACGCGQLLNPVDSRGRTRRFISGHNTRLRPHTCSVETLICPECKKEFTKDKSRRATFCSHVCANRYHLRQPKVREKLRAANLANGNRPPTMRGPDHPNWKGGITGTRARGTDQVAYKKWRRAVFARFAFTCQICGRRGGKLSAHHIVPWAECEALRYEPLNGECLCYACHMALHGLRPLDDLPEAARYEIEARRSWGA